MRPAIRALGWVRKVLWAATIIFSITLGYSAALLAFGGISLGGLQINRSGSELTISIPFSIKNPGYYDLSELNVTTCVADPKGQPILSSTTFVPLIPREGGVNETHRISLNLKDLFKGDLMNLFFQDANLSLRTAISLKFASILPVSILLNFSFPWGAPISNPSIEKVTPAFNGTHYLFTVVFNFENHSSLLGLKGALRLELYNSRGELVAAGSKTVDAPPGSGYRDKFELTALNRLKFTEKGFVRIFYEDSMFRVGPMEVPYG